MSGLPLVLVSCRQRGTTGRWRYVGTFRLLRFCYVATPRTVGLFLRIGYVCWCLCFVLCRTQTSVTLSASEVEYVVMSDGLKEEAISLAVPLAGYLSFQTSAMVARWFLRITWGLYSWLPTRSPPPTLKHIDIRHLFIRERFHVKCRLCNTPTF